MKEFNIRRTWGDVASFVDAAREASDANSQALGWLQSGVFDRYAKQGKLLVATSNEGAYVGHLLYDYSFPRAVVLQIYCLLEWRGCGVAKALLDSLKNSLREDNFLSIRASVAEDLQESNRFWEAAGFYVAKRRKGGVTTGRMILVRIHELDSPQLFSRSRISLRPDDTLGLGASPAPTVPVYLIDLNVVFDVAHRRAHLEDAERLLHASHSGECRVLISTEMSEELHRHAKDAQADPMIRMLGALPRIPVPKDPVLSSIAPVVAKALFPEKEYPAGLSRNDHSDIRHLVTAIDCQASAFVTRDQRILDAARLVERDYGLKILHPDQLWEFTHASFQDELAESEGDGFFEVCALGQNTEEAQDFLSSCGVNPIDRATVWLPGAVKQQRVTAVKFSGKLLALAIQAPIDPKSAVRKFRMAVDEINERSGMAARLLLQRTFSEAMLADCTQIRLEMPEKQSSLREAAFSSGFRSAPPGNSMTKVTLARAITPYNWGLNREYLHSCSGILLPKTAPAWSGSNQLIEIHCPDSERRHVQLSELEALLSPALFCLAGRPATIASIRPKFSEALLGSYKQLSLAPQMEAYAYKERLFLSAPKLFGQFVRGGLLFFYQSQAKGAQAIIAVARIVDVNLIKRDQMRLESLRRSVLSVANLREIGASPDKTACLFDNLVFLSEPVDLCFLKNELNYHSARLTSVGRLDDTQSLRILEKGFSLA